MLAAVTAGVTGVALTAGLYFLSIHPVNHTPRPMRANGILFSVPEDISREREPAARRVTRLAGHTASDSNSNRARANGEPAPVYTPRMDGRFSVPAWTLPRE